ncbi:unnamed protein product [Parajaminaea phylloscopi]
MASKKSAKTVGSSSAGGRGQVSSHSQARQEPPVPPATATAGRVVPQSNTAPRDAPPPAAAPNSPWILLPIALLFGLLASVSLYLHYRLPTPVSLAHSAASEAAGNGALFSEQRVVDIMQKLSVDIGYRIVGTREHVEAEEWLLGELKQYEGVHSLGPDDTHNVEVEIWRQIDDGAHRFDFMSSVVWKKYHSMSNVIVRISDGTEASKANSVLVNSHLDSTLPSPGAADDGVGVGIMMELLRILTTPGKGRKPLRNSVVLLFNNGEESLQDASHLYITSNHSTVPSLRSVINLEACGVSGPELLFQAQSAEMISAYSKVPHPFGTVLANDVFSSGIVLSDTDLRIFNDYGKVWGLDMAVIGNSYFYHTRKDIPEYIQPGVAQHFGENVLAIVDYLTTDPGSPLPKIRRQRTPRSVAPVYFSIAGYLFFVIPAQAFKAMSMGMSAFANFQLQSSVKAEKHFGALKATTLSILGAVGGLIAALASSNLVALVMTKVLDRPLSWYSHEWYPIPLYAPPAILANLLVQRGIASCVKKEHRPYLERAAFNGLFLFFIFVLIVLNAFSIGSAYLFALGAFTLLASLILNDFVLIGWGNIELRRVAVNRRVHPATYGVLCIVPAIIGSEGMASFLDLFVPLMGRTGEISPADHILASIVAGLSFMSLPMLLPLAHRFEGHVLRRSILFFLSVSVTAVAIYSGAGMSPFDAMHPKRLFTHQTYNMTSGQWHMNLGSADPASRSLFQSLADGLQQELGAAGATASVVEMNEYNADFDILYPVSEFITPWKFQLPSDPQSSDSFSRWSSPETPSKNFIVKAVQDELDLDAGTRRVTLAINHPEIIWSVLAFDAEILEWDLPVDPPQGFRRHHVKEVSRYGTDEWSLRLLLKLPETQLEAARAGAKDATGKVSNADFSHLIRVNGSDPSDTVAARFASVGSPWRLKIDFSGLWAEGMYPMAEKSKDVGVLNSRAVSTFRRMDDWLRKEHPEVDAMLLSVIAGAAIA